MKKLLTTTLAIALSFGVFSQQADTIAMTNCNQNTPGWGNSLGRVTFHNQGHNTTIQSNGISQIWSGAVTATACQKTTFAGGVTNNFNADCRSNPDFPGDLFSWCAVMRFANQLCPYPWRVPTVADFRNLDIALGGRGEFRGGSWSFYREYIDVWGGSFGGQVGPDGTPLSVSRPNLRWAAYWSQSERSENYAYFLFFQRESGPSVQTPVRVNPQGRSLKNVGRTLRCVRDN